MTTKIIPTIESFGGPAPAEVEDTATPCPEWCVVEHDGPGAFHAGPNVWTDGRPVRLFQTDTPGALPGVVVAGQWLSDSQAHSLGIELIGAAEVVRRARREAGKCAPRVT